MTPQPHIGDTTFSTEHRGLVRKVLRYHARVPITWDEFTQIDVDVSEPADLHKGQHRDDRFKALGKRAARIAEIVANAGNMVNELTRLEAKVADLRNALAALADASFARDATMGDPCRLIECKDSVRRAIVNARAVIAKVTVREEKE